MTSCSLLVINFRSASLALSAIATAREAYRGDLQVVIVDNSVDPLEARLLCGAGHLVVADRNLGYAGAINEGRKWCDGAFLLIANPDVRFAPGSIDKLLAADASVAGPALFWDDAFQWRLPPADVHDRRHLLDRVAASRSLSWAGARDRRRIRERIHFWSLTQTTRMPSLSGAVLAVRSAAFDAAGGFDERYPLYFEEHDFLRRVSGAVVYVPEAKVHHLYNQSAAASPEARSFYAQSERRYVRRWMGGTGAFLKSAERPFRASGKFPPLPAGPIPLPAREVVVEASPLANFDTAAGCFPRSGKVTLPEDIWNCYRGEVLYVRVVARDTGATIAAFAKDRMAP